MRIKAVMRDILFCTIQIGTKIGGKKCENNSLDVCIKEFENLYKEKTGNCWSDRDNFVKMPNKMQPIDIDHGVDEETADKILESNIESKLKKPVQNLMRLIFDVESMKRAMLEYEIDMDKMPLGKISKKQIQEAYSVLTELLALVNNGNPERSQLISASNKFYTLIPHSFGLEGPK